jgi:branched-subunit amino acid aminotransferase/4-amino-4-deoxychorismate lyase
MQIEGNLAQAEDAIMLDKDGFVSETNATNIVSIHTFGKSTNRHLAHDCSKTAIVLTAVYG